MPRAVEASIWASELKGGTLPPVCVKSGRPADSALTFSFDEPVATGWLLAGATLGIAVTGRRVKGTLPLVRVWRRTFLLLRAAGISAAAIGILMLITVGLSTNDWLPTWLGLGLGFLVASLVIGAMYSGLRPKGELFRMANGQQWVRLREIHPDFARAVAAMDEPFVSTLPPPAG
jgi:hypothetical protein